MSIWRYIFDNELLQRDDIDRLEDESVRASRAHASSVERLERRIRDLEDDLARVALFEQALFRALVESGTIRAEGLMELLQKIRAEAEPAAGQEDCPGCGRHLPPRRASCLYCGAKRRSG